jgi:uncharacterized membrane protein YsdA (DUF1294 family)
MRSSTPRRYHFSLALILCVLATIGLWALLGQKNTWQIWLCSWLVAINVITFGYYGYDKARAGSGGGRIPEIVLHGLSVAGGSSGAFLGMHLFRHKTIKRQFRILFWCIVVLQAALIGWLVKLAWWG